MSGSLSVIGIAALAGLAAVFQAQAMGLMNTRAGTVAAVVITYGLGGAVAIVIALVTRSAGLSDWRTIPVWALGAGLAGLIIVGSIAFATPRIGLVATFTVLVVSQFAFAAVIDHFGWLGAEIRHLDLSRVTGIAVLLVGTWLILR